MDPRFSEFPNINDQTLLPGMLNEYPSSDPFEDLSFLDPNPSNSALSTTSEGDDPEFSDSVLKYINQVLMEEDIGSKPCMFYDPLTLQATEESLYEVIRGENRPTSQNQNPLCVDQNVQSPDCGFSSGSISDSSSSPGPSNDSGPVNPQFVETRSSIFQNPIPENFIFQSPPRASTASPSNRYGKGNVNGNGNAVVGTNRSELVVPDVLSKNDLLLQFNRGAEEGSKFLPRGQVISSEGNKTYAVEDSNVGNVAITTQNGSDNFRVGSSRKKNHRREDTGLEDGRSNKQSAVYMNDDEEGELSDIFDKVLLCKPVEGKDGQVSHNGANNGLQQDGQPVGIGYGKVRGKNQGNKKEVIDLRSLLILCAQAVSVDDRETASELLKQIMQNSSPFGDSTQRLAHCFANALDARLAGTGTQLYAALSSKRMSAADMLKFYQAYIAACPFMKMSMIFANHMILKAAEKAETLHIIDFGILYGFQWPALIHCLSKRAGGPPKLRITGVELPLSGFRPEERVQETGHRLAKYCKRFDVPFEYYAIAKKWETVQFDDLKVQRNEVLAVNCLCRFKNLLDETVVVPSPRDTVLTLIRKLNPDVFVQCVVNGSYHAPFFVSRFREALLHFSSLFDMFDCNLSHDDPMRFGFEKEFIGREVVNIVACEGSERTVRPETYKQWQVRNLRAGFRQLPLDREVMNKIKDKVKKGYNPEFVVNEDGRWMLQGWKGRIIFASSCWAPSRT